MKKRFLSILFLIAIFAGILSPVSSSVSQGTLAITPQVAYADENAALPPDNPGNHIEGCGFTNILACVSHIAYAVPYSLGYWALTLSARMLDATSAITLSSNIYTKATFISDGWRLTRDFANIFFIIILLYVALALILGLSIGHANPKSILATLVAVALFINFSLFITQVIIDVSNSLALVFYNQITVVKDGQKVDLNSLPSDTAYGEKTRPISLALANSFKPQILASSDFYDCLSKGQGSLGEKCSVSGKSSAYTANSSSASKIPNSVMIPFLIIIGSLFLVAAYSFFIVSLAFIGRVIGLWIAIIFAPFAFASYIIPSTRNLGNFGWNDWLKTLVKTAFAAPVYFFFMLLISMLAQSDFAKINGSTVGEILIISLISVLLLLTLLLRATKYAREASGVVGDLVAKLGVGAAKFVGGAAIGVGAGAVAIAGRSTLGVAGSVIGKNKTLLNAAAGQNLRGPKWVQRAQQWGAKKVVATSQDAGKASFDVRQNSLANLISAKAGINMGSVGALSTKQTAGGWEAAVARQNAKDTKWKERLGYDKDLEKNIKKDKEDREKEITLAERNLNNVKAGGSNDDYYKNQLKNARNELIKAQASGNTAKINTAQQKVDDINKKYREDENTVKNAQQKLDNLKFGDKKQAGDKKFDANGREIGTFNEEEAKEWNNKKENMGLKDIEKAQENVKLGRFKNYLLTKAEDSGYHVGEEKRDAYGTLTGFHVDTKVAGSRNALRAFGRVAMSGGVTGLAVSALTGPIGAAVGAGLGVAAASAFREVLSDTLGLGTHGSKLSHAEGVHHSLDALDAKDKGGHGHEAHSKYHPGKNSILGDFSKIFEGGSGGGHSGGGHSGGGDHGHH